MARLSKSAGPAPGYAPPSRNVRPTSASPCEMPAAARSATTWCGARAGEIGGARVGSVGRRVAGRSERAADNLGRRAGGDAALEADAVAVAARGHRLPREANGCAVAARRSGGRRVVVDRAADGDRERVLRARVDERQEDAAFDLQRAPRDVRRRVRRGRRAGEERRLIGGGGEETRTPSLVDVQQLPVRRCGWRRRRAGGRRHEPRRRRAVRVIAEDVRSIDVGAPADLIAVRDDDRRPRRRPQGRKRRVARGRHRLRRRRLSIRREHVLMRPLRPSVRLARTDTASRTGRSRRWCSPRRRSSSRLERIPATPLRRSHV